MCSALALTGFAPIALAQETETAQVVEETDRLGMIVVTAQRREQDILDVPIAVTAFDAKALEAAGVTSLLDLNFASPSFFANTLADPVSNTPVRIRGIGAGGNPGFEGAVGIYIDGVYRSRAGAALTTFFDMGGVEILRGPQGTLFGKNTTAGAIILRTAAPVMGEFQGSLRASAGNYNTRSVEGMVNIPLADKASLRLAALYDETDGFFSNPVDGRDTAPSKNTGFRASLAFQPTDRFDGRLVFDWSEWDSPAQFGHSTRIDNRDTNGLNNTLWPSFATNIASGGAGYWYWSPDPTGANPGPADPFSYAIANNRNSSSTLKQQGLTLHLNHDLTDNLRLRSISGYRELVNANIGGDWDFGPLDFGRALDLEYEFQTLSQEVLLEGNTDFANGSGLEYVLGFNYLQEEFDYSRRASVGAQFGPAFSILFNRLARLQFADGPTIGLPACNGGVPNPALGCFSTAQIGTSGVNFQNSDFTHEETSYGLFGHLTYNISDQFAIIGGLRWNSIKKEGTHRNNAAVGRAAYWDLVFSQAAAFFFLNGAGLSSPDFEASTDEEEITYDLTLQYRPNDDMQFYAKYSRGFKGGGINLQNDAAGGQPAAAGTNFPVGPGRRFLADTPESVTFDPEFVDAYELGFRWGYLGAGRLGVTLFRSEYDDLQVSVFNGQVFQVINAGSSKTEGIEIENTWAITDNLTTNIGLTYMDASYGDDVVNLPAGRQRGLSPDLSLVLGAQYERPLTKNIDIYLNGNYSYYSKMFLGEGTSITDPLALEVQDAYGVAGFTLGLRDLGNWDVALFCKNCFGEEFFNYAFNHPFVSGGSPLGNPGDPMTYGVRLKKEF